MTVLNKAELLQSFECATWLVFNDYEWQLVADKTGLDTRAVLNLVEALVVTRGGAGSVIYAKGGRDRHPPGPGPASG